MTESTAIGSPMRFEGRELAPPERDHVEALDGRFRPASKRNLQTLARLGVVEIPVDELEILPRKARRRDGSGFYRYDEGVLDEGATATAYTRVGDYIALLREPGVEPHLVPARRHHP